MINDNGPLTLKEIENIFKDNNEDLSINRINRQNNPRSKTGISILGQPLLIFKLKKEVK